MAGPKDKRKKKEKEFKKMHKQWLEGLKEKGKGNRFRMEPYKGPEWNQKNLTPEEKWKRRKEAEKYEAMNNKGGSVKLAKKYFKGGMV